MSDVVYLDAAAATPAGRDYKDRFFEALDIWPGQVVLDAGCGPGTDLARMADAVTDSGSVIGVDSDPAMVAEARKRLEGRADVLVGDVHRLPLQESSVDRARTDRVLQHVMDPTRVVAELHRVVRPGGIVGMAEPDWDTLAIDDDDVETCRAFTRFLAGRVRNAVIGRQLLRLATESGMELRSVDAKPVIFQDFDSAEQILGLRRNVARAIEAGRLSDEAGQPWLERLETRPFFASFTFYIVTATATW